MASRKIIFFVIIGVLVISAILGLVKLSNSSEQKKAESVGKLSIWVVGGTSDDYKKLFEGAKDLIPEVKNATFDIRVFPNYESYRDVLLSTLASGDGPDIFMVDAGADDILASNSVAIPERFLDLANYEKRYEDIFLDLLVSEGEGKNITRSLKGIPIGYETLGVFYHKSLFPVVPKTWNDLDLLYQSQGGISFFPVNLGMGPAYTPSATDIIALFLTGYGAYDTKSIQNGASGLSDYLSYADTPVTPTSSTDGSNILSPTSLKNEKENLDSTGLSTIDLFIRGKIGMVIGYPSLIRDIEKAQKRANEETLNDLILTERIPAKTLGERKTNLARYYYFVVSQNTKSPSVSAKLLSYLMLPETLEKVRDIFPYLISPDRTIMAAQGNTPLSNVFARTRLDAFLPVGGEELRVYQYGLKTEYDKIFRDYIDRGGKIDIGSILSHLQKNVECKIESASGKTLSSKCLEE